MKNAKLLLVLPAVAMMFASVPTNADARTKDIVKYGAIGLGAAVIGNAMSQPRYQNNYYQQPAYSGYYQQPAYSGYYQQNYYQQPAYSGYYQQNYYQQPSYGYSGYYGYGY